MHSIKEFNLQPSENNGKTHRRNRESCESAVSNESSEGPPPLIRADLADKFTIHVDGEVIILDDVNNQVMLFAATGEVYH